MQQGWGVWASPKLKAYRRVERERREVTRVLQKGEEKMVMLIGKMEQEMKNNVREKAEMKKNVG
jgi:hypothetical protein